MQIDPTIFKAYDIRGIYPDQLDEEKAYQIARGFATLILSEVTGKPKIAVGADMRLSSPTLKPKVIQGLIDSGIDVVNIGLVSSPTFYFAVAYLKLDGGIQVSASHNPKEYNGLKMVRANAVPISGETGIQTIRDFVVNDQLVPIVEQKGTLSREDEIVLKEAAIQSEGFNPKDIKPFKIVIDPANAMGILDMDALFAKLNCKLIKINYELDGSFPGHEADPFKAENTRQISEKIIAERADLGIAIDGDADRYFILDEKGELVPPPVLRGLMAQIELRQNPNALVAYDIRPGKITKDMIEEYNGKSLVTRVGHSLIKEAMIKEGAVFGGEGSGHYFYKLPYGTFEAPMIMVLKLLKFLSEQDKPLSEIVQPYKKYFHSGEISTKVTTREQALEKIEEIKLKYADGQQILVDGLTVEYPDFWFNLRVSNTEPVIRLTVEARSEDLMKQKVSEIQSLVKK